MRRRSGRDLRSGSGCPGGLRAWRRSRPFSWPAHTRAKRKQVSSYVFAWAGFVAMVLVLLAIDLGVFNRKAHEITVKEAGRWSLITLVLAMMFAGLIWTHNIPTDIVG